MGRLVPFLAFLVLLIPVRAQAIQLRWISGATDQTFTEATRCTLVVEADSAEVTLPSEWRLLWVADTSAVQFTPLDSLLACQADTAQVSGIDGPSTPADSAANLITAHFCSGGETAASAASYLIDLPGGAHGKMKVVTLDLADSSEVIESNEVTFNSGVAGDYAPVILRASTVHRSTEFRLDAVGVGLDSTSALTLVAADGSWHQPLRVVGQSHASIVATASLAAHVPSCVAEARIRAGAVSTVMVPADPPPPLLEIQEDYGCVRPFEEILDPLDPYMIQPRDFAFVPGGWTPGGNWAFHLFYGRLNQRIYTIENQRNIGHVVSQNLVDWYWPRSQAEDTVAIQTREGRFDSINVWAPTVIQRGLTYYMFYTGVDTNGIQRIGMATSPDLLSWTQGDSVLEVSGGTGVGQVPWAKLAPGPPYSGKPQLRDPFVMEYPAGSDNYLMFFATVSDSFSPQGVIGVARAVGSDLTSWDNTFPLWNTAFPVRSSANAIAAESPHAFTRNGKWWLFWTVHNDTVWAESNLLGPADMANGGSGWTRPQKLGSLVPPEHAHWFDNWHASEYLKVDCGSSGPEYLAGYSDQRVDIEYTRMLLPIDTSSLFRTSCDTMTAGVPNIGPSATSPGLFLGGANPTRSRVMLRVELPTRMRVHVAVYDVQGRRVRTLLDEALPAGATQVGWDGCDRTGTAVGNGVFFARLTTAGSRQVARVLLIK